MISTNNQKFSKSLHLSKNKKQLIHSDLHPNNVIFNKNKVWQSLILIQCDKMR